LATRTHRPVLGALVALGIICLGVTALASLRTFAVQLFSIPSGSMEPTILVGDFIAVDKSAYGYSRYSLPFAPHLFEGRIFAATPRRGDLVVFRVPHADQDYVKRIVGLPGDRIQMRDGRLYINGTAVQRERIPDVAYDAGEGFPRRLKRWRETLPNGASYETLDAELNGPLDNTAEYAVPPGNYFVLGDNRDNSVDSRMPYGVGFVPAENLIGHVVMIYYSVEKDFTPRPDRIGLVPK
jgi:signal peptidase I